MRRSARSLASLRNTHRRWITVPCTGVRHPAFSRALGPLWVPLEMAPSLKMDNDAFVAAELEPSVYSLVIRSSLN